jgi:Domain of unknown function (DUF4440)
MKTQKRNFMVIVLIFLFLSGSNLFCGFQAFAEEWTEAQKEVLKTLESRWELIIKGDVETLVANLHANALIWWPQDASPTRKERMGGEYRGWFGWAKPVSYELKPVEINIVGNISTAFVYYKWESKTPPKTVKGRNFLVLIKQGGKWTILGSSSTPCEGNTFCY